MKERARSSAFASAVKIDAPSGDDEFQYQTGGDEVHYKTPKFGKNILEQMHTFYLEQQFCDFKIKVEGRMFHVHRLVFASSSDYFQAMLSHDMMETRTESTELMGITLKGIEPIIEYVYTGKFTLNLDNIHDVIAAATFLQIENAVNLCIRFLKEKMTFHNAEELLRIGDLFNVISLREYHRCYVLKYFLKFVETITFLKTPADELADYLSDDALITSSESILFHFCLKWYEFDPKNRQELAHKLFENVRINLDSWPLLHAAKNEDLFTKDEKCAEIVKFYENYLSNARKSYILNSTHRTRVRSTRKTLVQFGGVIELSEDYDSLQEVLNRPTNQHYGWNMSHIFQPDGKVWYNLNFRSYRTSHQRFVGVNGEAVLVGGYEYVLTADSIHKTAIRDVTMVSAQGEFDIRPMPRLNHARARHAAVYLNGKEVNNYLMPLADIHRDWIHTNLSKSKDFDYF